MLVCQQIISQTVIAERPMRMPFHCHMLLMVVFCGATASADESDVRRELQEHLHASDVAEKAAAEKFASDLEQLREDRTAGLKEIARKAVAAGDAVGARVAWLEVLRADRSDPDAREFFTTFDSLQKAIEDLEEVANPEQNREPQLRRVWMSNTKEHGNFVRFRHLGGKRWMQYYYDGGRWPCTEIRRTDGFIEISNDRLDQLIRLHAGKYYQSDRVTLKRNLWADGEEGFWSSQKP